MRCWSGTVDLAVHSVKDLPGDMPPGLTLSAIPEREDPRDVLITKNGETLTQLPAGTRVGTSSLRRQALLLHLHPGLRIELLRGNVDTRLRKQREGIVDATILAAAGLKRLGLMPPNSQILDENEFLPAIGQGALGIETRVDDAEVIARVLPLHHEATAIAVTAERAFLRRMGGSCRTPLAAKGSIENSRVHLIALIASPDGTKVIRGEQNGLNNAAEEVGSMLAERLLAQGGEEILKELEKNVIRNPFIRNVFHALLYALRTTFHAPQVTPMSTAVATLNRQATHQSPNCRNTTAYTIARVCRNTRTIRSGGGPVSDY